MDNVESKSDFEATKIIKKINLRMMEERRKSEYLKKLLEKRKKLGQILKFLTENNSFKF